MSSNEKGKKGKAGGDKGDKAEKGEKASKKGKGAKGGGAGFDDGAAQKRNVSVLDEAAMENAYNICHNVQDLLYFRGFFWENNNKKGKGKGRKKKGKSK